MKFLNLNSSFIRHLRKNHPQLQGKKLLQSGKFSGVFEGLSHNTVLKLSIDEASYSFHNTKMNNAITNPHQLKIINNFGCIGIYQLYKKMEDFHSIPLNKLEVPIFLYEVEKLEKIQKGTINHTITHNLLKEWQSYNLISCSKDLQDNINNFISHLRNQFLDSNTHYSIINALDQLKNFINEYKNESVFLDLHSTNIMQREDGTLVFSDPIADFQIYSYYYRTYKTL